MKLISSASGQRIALAAVLLAAPFAASAQAYVRERPTGLMENNDVMKRTGMDTALGRSVRSTISKPLEEAKKLIAAKDIKGAREKVATALLVPDRTGYENHVIARAKLAIAAANDEVNEVAALYEESATGTWYSTDDKAVALQTVGGVFYNAGQYKQAITWYDRYAELGGIDPITQLLRGQAYYLAGDFGGAAKVLDGEVDRAAQTGTKPPEIMLKLLADSSAKTSDANRYDKAAQLLAKYYPAKVN